MPRGQPDFGLYTETPVASGISDPGEAAARLGSINVFDRRGWTVWMDDFEAPSLKWTGAKAGVGELPILSSTTAFMGAQSVLLNVPAGAGATSYIRRGFPLIRLGKTGIEFWVQGFTKTTGYFRIDFDIWDGVNHTRARLHYDTNAGTISIDDDALGLTVVATNIYMTTVYYFLPIKLVIDMDNDKYTRLLVGSQELDISAYSVPIIIATTARHITVTAMVVGSAADNMWMYIDNSILTQNEP